MKIEHLRRAEDLYRNQGSITRHEIARLLNVSENEARIIRSVITDKETLQSFLIGDDSETSVYKEETDTGQTIVTRSSHIRTLDQLIDFAKIDLDVWEISKHVINSWGKEENENYQVKVFLKMKEHELNVTKIFDNFKEKAEKHAPEYKPIRRADKEDCLLEICTHDFHLSQLSWGKETRGADYDIDIAKNIYMDSIKFFLSYSESFSPNKILLLIGSDYLNSDNEANETSAGTRQDSDSRWQKTFDAGCDLAVEAIDYCRNFADTHVIIARGNHDNTSSYAVGKYIEAWYKNCKEVTVDNTPPIRKYYEYGRNLLGYTHKGKIDELPLIMAQEASEAWGRTNIREFKTGHLHNKKKYIFIPIEEKQAVRVVQCPSLAPPDAWHSEKGYNSIKEANGYIWTPDGGNIASFNYQPRLEDYK